MTGTATDRFSDYQVAELAKRAISPDQAAEHGIIAVRTNDELPEGVPAYWTVENGYLPATLHPWTSGAPGSPITWQIKPDTPVPDPENPGRPKKYLFAKGWQPVLHPVRVVEGSDRVLIVEGTHQRIAAGIYAPDGWSVFGIAGCRGWSTEGLPINDLLVCDGKIVTVVLDADMRTNTEVWSAGQALADELEMSGAVKVRFAEVTGGRNSGLDDVLGARPDERTRLDYVSRLLRPERCPEASKVKKPTRDAQRQAEKAKAAEDRRAREDADRARATRENRPMVDVSGDRHLVAQNIAGVLKRRWDGKHLFGRGTPAALVERNGDSLVPLTRDSLRDKVTRAMRTGRQDKVTGAWEDGWPDDGTLGVLLSRGREFRPLEQIVNSPFVRADGSICMTNGYDEESRTFVRMSAELAGSIVVPDEPTGEDVSRAVKYLLDEWLGDFPFPTRADRAGALALLLTPFVRGWMGVAPIAVIDGNGPSAGKGLLMDLIYRVVSGRPAILKALPSDNEETRKAITAALVAGRSMMVWDEAHVLEGKALAQLLTVPTWSDRRLGATAEVEIDNRVTFAALGNNVRVEGDVGRRAYRIRIHPQVEDQSGRDANEFRHPDIPAWTDEHRAELLGAVLTLIRAWVLAGRPSGVATFGSFETWSRTIGGILEHAGVPGFLEGRKEWLAGANVSGETWAVHLAWLGSEFGGRAFLTSDVAERLVRAGVKAPLPSASRTVSVPENSAAYCRSLGMVYHHRQDQTFYGLTLMRDGVTNGSARWRVSKWDRDRKGVTFTPPSGGDQGVEEGEGTVESSVTLETDNSVAVKGSSGSTGSPHPGPAARRRISEQRAAARGVGASEDSPSPPRPLPGVTRPAEVTERVDPRQDRTPLIDAVFAAHASDYVSRCDDGHEEVLVDGTWFACPVCRPATVAANDRLDGVWLAGRSRTELL
jgi:hypothetical protein